jgi:diaminopimelate epimerase
MMRTPFLKMHGAGNDFIMFDARELGTPGGRLERKQIAGLCNRRLGIGADGLIIIDAHQDLDFEMVYYNADGGEAEMCGNGARCAFLFANRHGLVSGQGEFMTNAGRITGALEGETVRVSLTPPRNLSLDLKLDIDHPFKAVHAVNTGVPHLVIPVDDLESIKLAEWGPRFRYDQHFGPDGTNVNWVQKHKQNDSWLIRTYERGVEAETLACGTGASASALVLSKLKAATAPVSLLTRGGYRLTISIETSENDDLLYLSGPAEIAFRGDVELS